MARFKVNDIITNGDVTLWITGVTEREYEFTDHNMNKFFLPIEGMDRNYCLYEPKSIWHKASKELPIKSKWAIIEYVNDFHDVGFYDEETKSFQIGEEYVEMNNVKRWAYIEDIVDL